MAEEKTFLDFIAFSKSTGATDVIDYSVPMSEEYSDFENVSVIGKLRNTAGVVTLKATVKGTYHSICDRCLEDVDLQLSADINTIVTAEGSKDDSVTVENGRIDLIKTAYDALSLEIPLIVHCSEDCKGICQNCGANLNREVCHCTDNKEE